MAGLAEHELGTRAAADRGRGEVAQDAVQRGPVLALEDVLEVARPRPARTTAADRHSQRGRKRVAIFKIKKYPKCGSRAEKDET